MTDKTTNPDSESDVEEEAEENLKTRAKAYLLAVYAYVAGAIAQSVEEIAPQLRSVSLPSVSSRAAKSLLLAGVLITAAVAMPAAPFDGGKSNVETQDPVQGETYEAGADTPTLNGATLNALPSSYTDASADAPDPPEQVRASAGSQTMNVQTAVVDGKPAIVLEDDQTHDGRWVSLDTAWFEENLGETPEAAYIQHESGDEYAAPLQVRGDSAAFYVREFSTNTVTFEGEVVLSGDQAGDGTQYEYELENTSGIDDPSINLTGVDNTAWNNQSASELANGDSVSLDIGGNADPTGPSQNNEPTVTFIGAGPVVISDFEDGDSTIDADGYSGFSGTMSTTTSPALSGSTSGAQEWNSTVSGPVSATATRDTDTTKTFSYEVQISDQTGNSNDNLAEVEMFDASGTGLFFGLIHRGDGVVEYRGSNVGSWSAGTTYTYDLQFDFSTNEITIIQNGNTIHTGSLENDVNGWSEVKFKHYSGSSGTTTTANWDDIQTNAPETTDPSIDTDGDGNADASYSGNLSVGEEVTKEVSSLSVDDTSADISTTQGFVSIDIDKKDRTVTSDPVVELNGETTSYSGTLADGETVSLSADNASLVDGTNKVNVSTNSPSSGPASLVGLEYRHGAETTVEATVDESTWSQTSNVSKTWVDDRANATATIPMNDRVVGIRDVEVRYNESSWESVPESDYTLDGTDLTVQLGDVADGETTEVRATGSKVRVTDGTITVLEPTTSSDTLNTKIQVDDAGADFALSVDETVFADRVHYAENATWGEWTGEARFQSSGEQTVTLPDATAGAEANVRTWPVEVAPTSGNVTVPEISGDRTEPAFTVRGDGNSEVDYTFVDAADSTPYVLYSQTNEIVRDEGLASSPITLTDDNGDETLIFLVDDDGTSSSSGSTSSVGGGAVMESATGGFTALQALIPSGQTALIGLALLGGLFVVGRRSGVITPERQQAATSAAGSALGTVNSLVERALDNEIVVGALILGGGAFVLGTDFLPEQTRLIVGLAAAPVAMYLALQQFGRFDFRIWAGSTAVIALLGLNVLAPGFFQTIAEEAGIIIVIGAIYLGYRAISAYREDASTPDEVTRLEIDAEERDD